MSWEYLEAALADDPKARKKLKALRVEFSYAMDELAESNRRYFRLQRRLIDVRAALHEETDKNRRVTDQLNRLTDICREYLHSEC